MAQYLLAIHRDYAVPLVPEATGQKWADINALIDRMTDGPYAETKEHLAGFWIVNAADLDEALEWAKLAALAEQRPIEVRPLFGGDLDDAIRLGDPSRTQ